MRRAKQYIQLLLMHLFFCINICHGQFSEQSITAYLMDEFDKMGELDSYDSIQGNKLVKENEKLKGYFDQVFRQVPATLHMGFLAVKNNLKIITSDDGKIRAYSWNSGFNDIENEFIQFQYRNSKRLLWNYKVDANAEGMNSTFNYNTLPDSIISIRTKTDGIVYLMMHRDYLVHTHEDLIYAVTAYKIKNNKFELTPFFKFGTKYVNTISYGIAPNLDLDYDKLDSASIHLSSDRRKLFIPVIGKGYSFNHKYLVYVFDGYNYVFDKNAK